MSEARERWMQRVKEAVEAGTLVRLSLASPQGGDPGLRRVRVRPVQLKAGPRLQFVWERQTQDLTRNFEAREAVAQVEDLLGNPFAMATAVTTAEHLVLDLRRGDRPRLEIQRVATPLPDPSHDRVKERRIEPRERWLHALGVTAADGRVCRGMEAKFRQIHRFVEILDPLLELAGLAARDDSGTAGPLRVVDMGCGKGYLTFAAHEHLGRASGRTVETTGVELRRELVEAANRHAGESGLQGLRFEAGSIGGSGPAAADLLMALHACDTATDDALAAGVQGGVRLLLVAPCCHREIRPQLRPPAVLGTLMRHGIFAERQAEFVTDGLRALLLEAAGYETRVFEFVSPEHTAKNLMIAAVKRRDPAAPGDADQARSRVAEFASFYGVREQRLARHLGIPLEHSSPAAEVGV